MMPDEPGDPIEIFRARGLPEAYAIRGLLEASDIPVRIENELLQGAVGDLPMGWATAPRIMVERKDESAARAIVDEHLEAHEGDEETEGLPLRCLACGFPMGEADVCPQCGWSYRTGPNDSSGDDRDSEADESPEPVADEPEPAKADPPTIEDSPPVLTRRALWAEVAAVLAIGVVPSIVDVATYSYGSTAAPRWADTLQSTVVSGCIIYATLYLMARSGEPWKRFGITRFSMWDIPVGLFLFGLAVFSRQLQLAFQFLMEGPVDDIWRPHGYLEIWLMVVKYAFGAFDEEIVMRAYLVTRLTQLLRSRGKAVVVAAILFASCHAYQGWDGLVFTFFFGLAYGLAFLVIRRIWPLAIGHAFYNIRLEIG